MTDNKNISGLINYNKEINYSIKEAIQEALVELMKNNDYNSITITALCKKLEYLEWHFIIIIKH